MVNKVTLRLIVSFAIVTAIIVVGSSIPLPGLSLSETALHIRQFQVCDHAWFHWWISCWVRYATPSHHDLASATLGFAMIIVLTMRIWRRFTSHKIIEEMEK